jgi:hypothetical protein
VMLLYAAIGMSFIGFGYMIFGKDGGERAARFYFGRSFYWMLGHIRALVAFVIGVLRVVVVDWIVLPIGQYVLRGLRWFVTRERGWLRPR